MTINPLPQQPDTLAGPGAPDGVIIRASLLPQSTHGSNIRGIVTKNTWDKLRIPVCDAADNRCEICGARGEQRPDCHEIWLFDPPTDEGADSRGAQRLKRLIALCKECHSTQHIGRAQIRGELDVVIDHLCRLNGWEEKQAQLDLRRAVALMRAQDAFVWDLDLGALNGALAIPGHEGLYITAEHRDKLGKTWRPAAPRKTSS